MHQLGGYRVQGKDETGAAKLIADALAQQEAGATLIVLEAIPSPLAAEVTRQLVIPTIGIGAGKNARGRCWSSRTCSTSRPARKRASSKLHGRTNFDCRRHRCLRRRRQGRQLPGRNTATNETPTTEPQDAEFSLETFGSSLCASAFLSFTDS